MFMTDRSALMTPQNATLDSNRTLSWFVSYRHLSSQFQFSLSAVTLGYLSQWSSPAVFSNIVNGRARSLLESTLAVSPNATRDTYKETGDSELLPAQLAGRRGQMMWNSKLYGEEKIFYTGPTRAAQAGKKSLLSTRRAQPTKEGFFSYAILESPFASVSTVSRGTPIYTVVSLIATHSNASLQKLRGRTFVIRQKI